MIKDTTNMLVHNVHINYSKQKKGEVHINATKAVNVLITSPCTPFNHNISTSIAVEL